METETRLIHSGSGPEDHYGFVNQPVYRGSTVLYKDVKSLEEAVKDPFKKNSRIYGRLGTPSARNLESILADLEGGCGSVVTCSGLSAISTSILAYVEAGAHILIVDSVYYPVRNLSQSLKKFGIEAEFYDPTIGAGIKNLIRENTRLVYMESPGSMTFEVQDVREITRICKEKNVVTMIDNTWATPLFFSPLDLGVDISIHSATKYISGHSDSFLGAVICRNNESLERIRHSSMNLGQCAGADDIYLALRGLKTLSVRLNQHQEQAIQLSAWLKEREEVEKILFPIMTEDAGHELWKRDFSGASGLFSIVMRDHYKWEQINAMVDSLNVFGIGHSWGGFESLVIPSSPGSFRTLGNWKDKKLLRLHIGLENINDLKEDLINGFEKLKN